MVLGLAAAVASATRTEPPTQGKNIFILSGQSNMAGRGHENCTYCKPGPNILMFNPALQWVEAKDPLHQGIDIGKANGVGPGMPFATRIFETKADFGVIGLVPCAIGATALDQWKKGEKLYNDMIARSKASLKDGGVIRALLWYQGEADVASPTASTYAARFVQMVNDIRSDLQLPSLPVIQVALNKKLDQEDCEIRKQQLGTNSPNVVTVDAKGSSNNLGSDGIHLDTAGQTHVGQLLADSFLQNFA